MITSTKMCLTPPFFLFLDMECGFPAQVPNGHYTFLNGTRGYKSIVRYSCDEGHVMVGRSDLMCDIDQKWNGPPPRCDVLVCPEPPPVPNGASKVIQRTGNSLTVEYECDPKFTMSGPKRLVCADGSYDQPPPVCKGKPGVAPPVLIVVRALFFNEGGGLLIFLFSRRRKHQRRLEFLRRPLQGQLPAAAAQAAAQRPTLGPSTRRTSIRKVTMTKGLRRREATTGSRKAVLRDKRTLKRSSAW